MTGPDPELVERLRNAHQPWPEKIVVETAQSPAELKRLSNTCATCEAPCESGEVCATVVGHESGLLDEMSNVQAFHHIESGMERLQAKGRASIREEGEYRPHTFVSLTDD